MHQIRFPMGLRPDPVEGAYSAPPDLPVFKGPTSKGREGEKGREQEGESREGEGGEGKESEGRGEREDGSMHPLGFSKVGAYALDNTIMLLYCLQVCKSRKFSNVML